MFFFLAIKNFDFLKILPNCQKCAADFAVVQVKSVPLLWKQFTFQKLQEMRTQEFLLPLKYITYDGKLTGAERD